MKPYELANIEDTSGFRNLGSAEGKYFTTSGAAASSYARQAVANFSDLAYTTVRTQISTGVLRSIAPATVDGGIPAYVIPEAELPALRPTILKYSPVR